MYKFTLNFTYDGIKYSLNNEKPKNDFCKVIINDERIDSVRRYRLEVDTTKEITITDCFITKVININETDKLFCNGYQSLTESNEYPYTKKLINIKKVPKFIINKNKLDKLGDYNFVKYNKNWLHSFTYAYVRKEDGYQFIGSLNDSFAFTIFNVKRENIKIVSDVSSLNIIGKNTLLDFIICNSSSLENCFSRYSKYLNIKEKETKKLVCFSSSDNESVILEAINKENDLILIENGYTTIGDYFNLCESKFPNGLLYVVNKIHQKDILAGITISPFCVSKNSELYKNHKEYLRKVNNKYIECSKDLFVLDILKEEVKDYIVKVCKYYTKTLKFDFIKLDNLYSACLIEDKYIPKAKILKDALELIRINLPNTILLGAKTPLAPTFNILDYCSICPNIKNKYSESYFSKFLLRERYSTKNSLMTSLYRNSLNKIGFLNVSEVTNLKSYSNPDILEIIQTINYLCSNIYYTNDLKEEIKKLKNATVTNISRIEEMITITYNLDNQNKLFIFDIKRGKILKR